jgi:hypothetical protein
MNRRCGHAERPRNRLQLIDGGCPAGRRAQGWRVGSARRLQNLLACRACHAPLMGKDFVQRYDEHFSKAGTPTNSRR